MSDSGLAVPCIASTSAFTRKIALSVGLVAALLLTCLAFMPTQANAAFTISGWNMTPSTTQAGGHPNVNFHLDPDAAQGDQTGDDLKSVKVEFAAGMLANPQAVSQTCATSNFN